MRSAGTGGAGADDEERSAGRAGQGSAMMRGRQIAGVWNRCQEARCRADWAGVAFWTRSTQV